MAEASALPSHYGNETLTPGCHHQRPPPPRPTPPPPPLPSSTRTEGVQPAVRLAEGVKRAPQGRLRHHRLGTTEGERGGGSETAPGDTVAAGGGCEAHYMRTSAGGA